MRFLPIVARELRVAARRRATYWLRTGVALAAVILGFFFYFGTLGLPSQAASHRIFLGLVGLAMVYCLAAGRRSTADCLSEEKREGTLGLLFLTDLKGYDVVLGKLAATSLDGFYQLLAVLPVLAVPLLMGGISNGEFWRAVLVLVNAFLFSLAVGMLVSSLNRELSKTMGFNLLVLLLLVAGPLAAGFGLKYVLSTRLPLPQAASPLYPLAVFDDATYPFAKQVFWESLALVHGLIWLMLALASWIVPSAWQDRAAGAGLFRWRERWHNLNYGNAGQRTTFRNRLLERNAFYWLAARARTKPVQVWGLLVVVGGWWIWGTRQYGEAWSNEVLNPVNIAAAVMAGCMLKLWVAIEAGHRLAEDRKAGAFEWLLTTPLSVREIIRGQFLALRRQFLLPLVAVVAVELWFWRSGLGGTFATFGAEEHSVLRMTWLGLIGMLAADVLALSWVGMSMALTARSPNLAIIGTISRILLLPWVILWAVGALTIAAAAKSSQEPPGWRFYLGWWFWLGLAADLVFGLAALSRLRRDFRFLAVERRIPTFARLGLIADKSSMTGSPRPRRQVTSVGLQGKGGPAEPSRLS